MAKDQIHHYLRTGVLLATIIFAGGGWTMKIKSNSERIAEEKTERVDADKALTAKAEKAKDDIHLLALNAKDTQALAAKAVELFNAIQNTQDEQARKSDAAFDDIQAKLSNHSSIQAVNSTILKTLTKD